MTEPTVPRLKERELAHQFVTPFMTRRYENVEELNTGLQNFLRNIQKTEPNHAKGKSTVGGYHTDMQLFQRKNEHLAKLATMISEAARDYITEYVKLSCSAPPEVSNVRLWGWAVILRPGDLNVAHIHPDARISGVYYVQVPRSKRSKDEEGAIMFSDPRPRAEMNAIQHQIGDVIVQPEEGMMILFPAYHTHAVLPFREPGERMSIAFNAWF